MTPGVYNYGTQYKGDTITARTVVLPESLVGATLRMQLKKTSKTGPLHKELLVGDGLTMVNAAGGELVIDEFIVDITTTIFWDLEVTLSDGTIKTYLTGSFKVDQDVTN